jgi:hypothetical protein
LVEFIDMSKERLVSAEERASLAKQFNVELFEVSAKTRQNIDQSFVALVRLVCEAAGRGFYEERTNAAFAPKATTSAPKKKSLCALL